MNRESQITVIIPVYNVAQFLPQCLESVCAQDDSVGEILIINDGSTDNSPEICEKYALKDSRIRIIHQNNKGLSAVVRKGIFESKCNYIGFVDGDDFIEPNMFRLMLDGIKSSNVEICVCMYDTVDENGRNNVLSDFGVNLNGVVSKQDGKFLFQILPSLKNGRFFSGSRCNKLFKKESLLNSFSILDVNVRVGEDIALVTPILMAANSIFIFNNYLYHYRQRKNSIVHVYKRENLLDWKKIIDILHQALDKFQYKVANFNDNAMALLISVCLYKLKISTISYQQKKEELKFISDDPQVKKLLSNHSIKMGIKYRIIFSLLKHGFYGILARIY